MSASDKKPKMLLWWLTLTDPLPQWETDDLQQVRNLLAEKPPNKELKHPIFLGYLAGLFQGLGEFGYIEIFQNKKRILTPFVSLSGDKEAVELVARLIGDVQEKCLSEDGKYLKIVITGLRSIILLRLIHPYLRGSKRTLTEKIVEFGYKISDEEKYQKIRKELGVREIIEELPSKCSIKMKKRVLKT